MSVHLNRVCTEVWYSKLNFWEVCLEILAPDFRTPKSLEQSYFTNNQQSFTAHFKVNSIHPSPSFKAQASRQLIPEACTHIALIPLGVPSCLGFILLSELFIVSVCDSESCLFLSKFWGVLADSELFLVLANPLFSAPEIKYRFEITGKGRGTPVPACGPGEAHGL